MPYKQQPYYPNKKISYGTLFFFIRHHTNSLNAFDKKGINEAKHLILKEARNASPSYKMFIRAAIAATGLSESTIKQILYTKKD